MMNRFRKQHIVGWIAVGLSVSIIGFWAFWGINEAFHEGWYYESLAANLGLTIVQYLSPMLLYLATTLTSLFWPRAGGILHAVLALLAAWFLDAWGNPLMFIFVTPLIGLGALYWFGRPRPRRVAIWLVAGLPIITLLVCGIEPVVRVSQRVDDGNLQARLVRGNEMELVWAPDGPGWPRKGANWYEAQRRCQHLDQDGLKLARTPQRIWRLPTVDEAVRSGARHGHNSGGEWHAEAAEATYEIRPDKESPLWNVHSQVIYWWTATEVDAERAYIIVYDGKVWPRSKSFGSAYMGYRCVKDP
jgi:hypothetical protein